VGIIAGMSAELAVVIAIVNLVLLAAGAVVVARQRVQRARQRLWVEVYNGQLSAYAAKYGTDEMVKVGRMSRYAAAAADEALKAYGQRWELEASPVVLGTSVSAVPADATDEPSARSPRAP